MKKVLLGTVSVLGLALLTQPAAAQVSVRLGGYVDFRAGFWDVDGVDSTDREFRNDTEIHVRADGKADNGLLYGAHIEMDSSGADVFFDENNLYVAGDWGRIELGDQDGASDQLGVYAPIVGIGQIEGDQDSFLVNAIGGGELVKVTDSSDATKATYFTPTFAGFRAGVSYAPESNSGDSVVTTEPTTGYSDWIEAGARYSGEFSGVAVVVGAGYSQAEANTAGADDPNAWQAGVQVGFSGFTVGGGYSDYDDYIVTRNGLGYEMDNAWNVGASYSAGAFAVGVSYSDLELVEDTGDYSILGVGAAYTVAPGLLVQADYYNFENDRADDEGQLVILSTRVTF